MEVLALAKLEIGGTWLCDCCLGHADDVPDAALPHKTRCSLGGAVCCTEKNGKTGKLSMRSERPEKGKKKFPMVEGDLLEFVDGVQLRVSPHIGDVALCICCNQAGHLFRADVSCHKSVWRDWVIVDWHREGQLPNRIYGFVDLRALPAHLTRSNRINCGYLNNIKPGICAIVEATVMFSEGLAGSELFDVLTTEASEFDDGAVSKLNFVWLMWRHLKSHVWLFPTLVGQTTVVSGLNPRPDGRKCLSNGCVLLTVMTKRKV